MNTDRADNDDAVALRRRIGRGEHTGPTSGLAPGFVQANVVILPASFADSFAEFCELNPRPCPLIARSAPGDPTLPDVAAGADVRTDAPRYRVFRDGRRQTDEPIDIGPLWRDDLVTFLLGCSFTFENALLEAGLPVRHVELGRNVPMYRTSIRCRPAEPFAANMVVSARPFRPDQLDEVRRITSQYPRMHGAPLHVGDPAAIGVENVDRVDFGDPLDMRPGETPVFWACGVTPQLAIQQARPPLAITHSPGCMFVTDLRHEAFCESMPG